MRALQGYSFFTVAGTFQHYIPQYFNKHCGNKSHTCCMPSVNVGRGIGFMQFKHSLHVHVASKKISYITAL